MTIGDEWVEFNTQGKRKSKFFLLLSFFSSFYVKLMSVRSRLVTQSHGNKHASQAKQSEKKQPQLVESCPTMRGVTRQGNFMFPQYDCRLERRPLSRVVRTYNIGWRNNFPNWNSSVCMCVHSFGIVVVDFDMFWCHFSPAGVR